MSRLDPMNGLGARPKDYPRHVFGSASSRAGAAKAREKSETLEEFVLSVLRIAGADGLTDFEIQAAAEREGITSLLRPRRADLTDKGNIVDSKVKRTSPVSGVKVIVWVLREFAP